MSSPRAPRKVQSRFIPRVVVKVAVLASVCLTTAASPADRVTVKTARLARLQELNAASMRDLQVTNAVLGTAWPVEMRNEAADALHAAIQALPRGQQLNASAVCCFVESNDSVPASLVPYLNRTIPLAAPGDKYFLLRAICRMRAQSGELREVVEDELNAPSYVVALQAAAALLCMDRGHSAAMNALRSGLRGESEGILWRSADATGRCGMKDPDFVARLKELLAHPDVRVRATAAIALWKLTGGADTIVPLLRAGLIEKDVPLSLAFISPSNPGEPHRAYIVRNLSTMRRHGVPLLPDLLAVMEDAAIAEDARSLDSVSVAMTALSAIAGSGAVTEAEFALIRSIVARNGSIFRRFPEETAERMEQIQLAR